MLTVVGVVAGIVLLVLFVDEAARGRDRDRERAMKAALCQKSGCDIESAVRP